MGQSVDLDSAVSMYELQSLELQKQLNKTKGATVFAITSNIEKDSDGVPTIVSRLAISVKRRLVVYSWHDAELIEPEVSHPSLLPLSPHSAVLCNANTPDRNSLCQIEREH